MVTYPIDWDERSIGDFVHVGRGASPRPIEAFLTSSVDGVNWIKIGDAPRYGKYITQTAEKITQSGATRSVRVNAGDFILSNSMSFGRPYILNIDGCIHDGWLRLYDYQDSVDKEFLYYVLSSEDTKKQYATFAAGSGVQNLNKAVVKKVVVHLPSIPEQKRIARALSEMDDHIDNLAELIEKKKAIRDGTLEDLVSGRTKLDGHACSWTQVNLGSVASYRKSRDVQPRKLYISTENMNQMFSGIVPYEGNESVGGTVFFPGDTLIANIRPYLKKIWCAEFSGTCSADVLVLAGNDRIVPKFLYYSLANDRFINYVMTGGIKGIKMPRGDKKYIMNYPVLIPSDITEQKTISDMLSAMDDEIKDLEDERNKMIQIREGAMDDLLTGRVRLSL